MSRSWELSFEAHDVLAAAEIRDGRLYLDGRPSRDADVNREVKRALESMGWRWDKGTRSYVQVPDPVSALARAVETCLVSDDLG